MATSCVIKHVANFKAIKRALHPPFRFPHCLAQSRKFAKKNKLNTDDKRSKPTTRYHNYPFTYSYDEMMTDDKRTTVI